jgi:hypothetical protein
LKVSSRLINRRKRIQALKVIHPDIVKSGEQKLIRYLAGHLDREAVRQCINSTYDVDIREEPAHTSGRIVAAENEVAFRLDFDVKVSLSLFLSRDGQVIGLRSPELRSRKAAARGPADPTGQAGSKETGKEAERKKKASEIARMISEINE